MNLFIIGYRCCGKTTVGKAVAAKTGWSFVDSDVRVIEECGKSIKDIVDTEGWTAFRRMERSTLKRICTKDRQVVATGGGVVLDPDNVRAMHAGGKVIWLSAAAETILKRMRMDNNSGDFRPALTDKGSEDEIEDMLFKRNPYYQRACDFVIHTDGIPVEEIAQTIIKNYAIGPVTR